MVGKKNIKQAEKHSEGKPFKRQMQSTAIAIAIIKLKFLNWFLALPCMQDFEVVEFGFRSWICLGSWNYFVFCYVVGS